MQTLVQLLPPIEGGLYNTMTIQQETVSTTYAELRKYFTEQELDDAAVIARHLQHHEEHLNYAEIYIQVLLEMRS